jgi:hypothetical protein
LQGAASTVETNMEFRLFADRNPNGNALLPVPRALKSRKRLYFAEKWGGCKIIPYRDLKKRSPGSGSGGNPELEPSDWTP